MPLAVVWHFWIGVSLVLGALLVTVAVIIGYVYKVVLPKYPRR